MPRKHKKFLTAGQNVVYFSSSTYKLVKSVRIPKKNSSFLERCKSWIRIINFGRVMEVLDLLELGKNVSNLMERLRTENVSTQQELGKKIDKFTVFSY